MGEICCTTNNDSDKKKYNTTKRKRTRQERDGEASVSEGSRSRERLLNRKKKSKKGKGKRPRNIETRGGGSTRGRGRSRGGYYSGGEESEDSSADDAEDSSESGECINEFDDYMNGEVEVEYDHVDGHTPQLSIFCVSDLVHEMENCLSPTPESGAGRGKKGKSRYSFMTSPNGMLSPVPLSNNESIGFPGSGGGGFRGHARLSSKTIRLKKGGGFAPRTTMMKFESTVQQITLEDHAGWVQKKSLKGGFGNKWRKRYLVLKRTHLLWATKEVSLNFDPMSKKSRRDFQNCVTVLQFGEIVTHLDSKDKKQRREFTIVTSKRPYTFRCREQKDADEWISMLDKYMEVRARTLEFVTQKMVHHHEQSVQLGGLSGLSLHFKSSNSNHVKDARDPRHTVRFDVS